MNRVARLLAAVMIAGLSTSAGASCGCSCVNGQIEPVCTLPTDLPPVCAPRACTLKPARRTLVNQANAANIAKGCQEKLVLNPQTGAYISRQVCR